MAGGMPLPVHCQLLSPCIHGLGQRQHVKRQPLLGVQLIALRRPCQVLPADACMLLLTGSSLQVACCGEGSLENVTAFWQQAEDQSTLPVLKVSLMQEGGQACSRSGRHET